VELVADVLADVDERERVHTTAPDRLEGVWDADQLRRAIWNLVTNALKYGPSGAPVHVVLERSPDGVAAAVHNPGPPIPPEEQSRIFEPFGRAPRAEARARGWGLGLTLVRGCAAAHGGTLELASTAERGTTFTLRLPLDARATEAAGA
jgi:signal transduction histidine kinase